MINYRDKITDLIIDTFGRSNPGPGCTFIATDGTFINIYPKLDCHEDLCYWVEEQLDIDIPYEDEEYFVREFNWVRLRMDPSMLVVELPKSQPSSQQWNSLEDWLLMCENDRGSYYSYNARLHVLYVGVIDGDSYEYQFGKDIFAEDIMKILRRSYTSGKFYASTDIMCARDREYTLKEYLSKLIGKDLYILIWYKHVPRWCKVFEVFDDWAVFGVRQKNRATSAGNFTARIRMQYKNISVTDKILYETEVDELLENYSW